MPQDVVAPEGEPPKRAAELESLQRRREARAGPGRGAAGSVGVDVLDAGQDGRAARPGHRVGVAEEEDKDVE
ncbi:hypothetical protein C3Y87_04560 [Carbonactinospora thermoautotrophica]|nr:hypothetical protein [Carbonactinospora thermoautotrophica]